MFFVQDFNHQTGAMTGRCVAFKESPLCFQITSVDVSDCLCRVGGCAACPMPECTYCGQQDHRGIGFCYNSTNIETCVDSDVFNVIVVHTCPIAGMPAWSTWVINSFAMSCFGFSSFSKGYECVWGFNPGDFGFFDCICSSEASRASIGASRVFIVGSFGVRK